MSREPEPIPSLDPKDTYIGDGVYVSWDGDNIKLYTVREDHRPHIIYINQDNVLELVKYIKKIYEIEILK